METINDLDIQIAKGRFQYLGPITITCSDNGIFLSNTHFSNTENVEFNNCKFTGNYLEISGVDKTELGLRFLNCTFEIDLKIEDCKLQTLGFAHTKKIKSIELWNCESNYFYFKNDENEKQENKLYGNLSISNLTVKNSFEYKNINHVKGKFSFSESPNISIKVQDVDDYINFENNTFNIANFNNVTFNNKVSFNKTEILKNCNFDKCDFFETTWFESCLNNETGSLKFIACKFKKYSLFDNSFFNTIEISHTKFEEKVSFENFNTDLFKIHQVSFLDAVYFDDLNKSNDKVIENWDRKTLRAIKREIVNTHNQIDYLRFKAYELKAYRKEIDINKLSWKDSLILYFNQESNNFGLDWTKGIRFIFQWSFIFYILYIILYSARIDELSKIPNISDFLVNYLKFTNPLSFLDPPLDNSEDYFLPLITLSLGKIFVSYGIYQTIQAFRKFGVNGG
ncbi:hypothetical protein OX284_000990 [Flavobacterium sp. SUN046]|uniref:hypothetical protein n=1 Tax=Flavobacterium sp. SUN046 TaxID=3002440 RepID=UPI002DB784C5|nr:hypothetical protein [Flavobacterium sp. SUN046]MEC4047989.1 hypothetical protein [Flavobacterium sp. SUN046]